MFSHSAKQFRRRSLLCFRKIVVPKIFLPQWGISRSSFGNLLSHSTEKHRRGTILCFTKFLVSKNFLGHKEERVEGRITFSCQKFFVSVPKNFENEAFCFLENFWYRFFLPQRGITRSSIENLLCHSTKKLGRGTLLCFTRFLEPKNFMPTRRISRSPYESLLSHSTENIRRGTLLCYTTLLVSKSFFCLRGENHVLHSKNCCLTVPRSLVGEPFCVIEKLWYRKFLWIRKEKGVSGFFVKSLLSHSVEKIRRRSLLIFSKKNSGIEKTYASERNITIFIRQFVVSKYRKTS